MSLVHDLYRKYGDFVVDIPSWEILDEGTTVLWGISGSGKSSLLRILMGFDQQAKYHWKFGSLDLAQVPPRDRRLGVVDQGAALFPHLTAEQNMLFGAEARGLRRDESLSQLASLIRDLGLESCASRKAEVLSGGERQRVALVRALLSQPRILFLDEPFSALDGETRQETRRAVRALVAKMAIPVVLVTHDQDDLEGLHGKISEMKLGRVVFERAF